MAAKDATLAPDERQAIALLRLSRPRQWVKNAFVAAPLFFTPAAVSPDSVLRVAAGILCFCALSSAVYILNDYVDRDADRLHALKRNRPLAAGTVSPVTALVLMGVLTVAGLLGAFFLDFRFGLFGAAYFSLNLFYSLGLKRVSILDVMMVSFGFVLRVYAGGFLIGVAPTVWIIVCTGLLALFLALAKRRDDIAKGLGNEHRASLAGYSMRFLDTAVAIVLGALVVSYIIYTTDLENRHRFGTDQLFITTPFVVAAVLRYLQITIVEERSGSPTDIVLADRFLILAVIGWLVTFGWLIYQ